MGGDLAGDVGVVLDRDRDAEQRALVAAAAAAVGLVGLDQRALGEHDAEGVERGVEPRDALEARLGQLARGELAGGDQLRLAREPGVDGVGGHGHGGAGYRSWDDRPLHVTAVAPIAEGLARFEARGPCTDAERRAAAWLHDELRDAGHEAWVETHWVRPQWPLSIALHATVGVVASLVAISAPLPGLIAAAVAAVSMALEGFGLPGLLRLAFPRRATQNVLTVPEEGRRHAAHRGSLRGAPGWLRAEVSIEGPPAVGGGRAPARRRCARGCGRSTSTGCGSGCCSSCRRSRCCSRSRRRATRRSPTTSPGGEAPPAVAVALHDELRRNPPDRLSPALLLHGALRAHLRREKPDRRTTVLLELGPGSGYASSHPKLRAAAEAAGAGKRVRRPRLGRVPTLWIGVDSADVEALDLALACVDAIDAELP